MPVYNYTTLDHPLATNGGQALGINGSGQIVGDYLVGTAQHAFLYNPNGGTYTTLDDPLATNGTVARGINDSGQIVGNYNNAGGTHGFLYNAGTYTTLDHPFTNGTVATGINASGQIVGQFIDASNQQHGFLLINGTYFTLDDPLASGFTIPNGISDAVAFPDAVVMMSGKRPPIIRSTAFRAFMRSPSLPLTKGHPTLATCRPRVSRVKSR